MEKLAPVVVLIGPPGAGKDTQATYLVEKTGFSVYSTGEELRNLSKQNSLLGKKIAETINVGNLMPAWFATYLFRDGLFKLSENEGLITTGTGRSVEEATGVHETLSWMGRPYRVMFINVPVEELRRRTEIRKQEEDRVDDSHFENRIKEYERSTLPAMDYFRERGALVDIDGAQAPEKVHEDIWKALAPLLS